MIFDGHAGQNMGYYQKTFKRTSKARLETATNHPPKKNIFMAGPSRRPRGGSLDFFALGAVRVQCTGPLAHNGERIKGGKVLAMSFLL